MLLSIKFLRWLILGIILLFLMFLAKKIFSENNQKEVVIQKTIYQNNGIFINIPNKDFYKIRESDIVLGNKNSDLIVIEHSAFTCAHCHDYYKNIFLKKIKKQYINTNKIAYVIRESIVYGQDLYASLLCRLIYQKFGDTAYQDIKEYLILNYTDWLLVKDVRDQLRSISNKFGITTEEYDQFCKDKKNRIILKNLIIEMHDITNVTPIFFIKGNTILAHDVVNTIEKHLKST